MKAKINIIISILCKSKLNADPKGGLLGQLKIAIKPNAQVGHKQFTQIDINIPLLAIKITISIL